MKSELFTDYSDHPRKLVTLNPKLKSTGADAAQLLFPLVGCSYRSSLAWKTSLRKVRTALQQIKERGALPMIDRDIWSGNLIVAAISGLHSPGAGYGQFEHKADSLIAKFKEAGGNGQRDWCMSRVTAIISALAICIIVCLSWAVNHYRDNAITYKAQRQKCQRTEAGERNYWHADASAWCCCARCKIHEGVSRC